MKVLKSMIPNGKNSDVFFYSKYIFKQFKNTILLFIGPTGYESSNTNDMAQYDM